MMSLIRGGGWSDLARGARLGAGDWNGPFFIFAERVPYLTRSTLRIDGGLMSGLVVWSAAMGFGFVPWGAFTLCQLLFHPTGHRR
jgi:hypothetical protein